jgi:TPR repeat protein
VKARSLLEDASAAGVAEADFELAQMLLAANATDEAGIAALMRGAERGDPKTMMLLARCYETGQIVAQDAERAFYWFQQAAAAGNADAEFKVASAYRSGLGVAADEERTQEALRQAVEAGSWEAEMSLGIDLENAKDLTQANYYYWRAAESDYAPAQVNLGAGYLSGDRGLRQDFRSALHWFYEAREDALGAEYAAQLLDAGLGVSENSTAAFALLQPIADRTTTTKSLMAMMLVSGRGTTADPARAGVLFDELEGMQDAGELNSAAWLLATHPNPEARQPELAVRLAQRSVDLDPASGSMDTLAVAHAATGNYEQAVRWLERALAAGEGESEATLAMFNERLASFRAGQPWTDGPYERYEYDTPVETSKRVRAEFIGEIVSLFQRNNESPARGLDTEVGESQFGLQILVQSVESGSLPYFMRDYAVFYIHSPTIFFSPLPQDVAAFTAPVGPFRFVLTEITANGWSYELEIEPVTTP